MIAEAIRLMLLDISDVTDWVAEYKSAYAIFCLEVAPPDCETPLITIAGEGGPATNGILDSYAADVALDITLWQSKSMSTKTMRELALTITTTLDGENVTLEGYWNGGLTAGFPQQIEDEDGFQGARIPLTISIMEV